MPLTIEQVMTALAKVNEPSLGKPITELGLVKDLSVAEGDVRLTVELPPAAGPSGQRREKVGREVRAAIGALEGVKGVEVRWAGDVPSREIAADDPVPEVKNVILVMSG